MRHAIQEQIIFKKELTQREKIQYILDPDVQKLELPIEQWAVILKWSYVALNIIATAAACIALVALSYPEYVDSASYSDFNHITLFNVIELLSVLFFTIDYGLRFYVHDGHWKNFVVYDVMNVLELFTTIPYYLQVILASSGVIEGDLFRVLFVMRMIRAFRLCRYHSDMALIIEALLNSTTMLILFLMIAMITIMITSTAFFFAERQFYDAPSGMWYRFCPQQYQQYTANFSKIESWHDFNPNATTNKTNLYVSLWALECPLGTKYQVMPIQSITDAMYWSVITITTVGFTQQGPTSTAGRVVAAITACVGVLFFVAPAVILTANFKEKRSHKQRLLKIMNSEKRTAQSMLALEKLRKEMERTYRLLRQQDERGNAREGTSYQRYTATSSRGKGLATRVDDNFELPETEQESLAVKARMEGLQAMTRAMTTAGGSRADGEKSKHGVADLLPPSDNGKMIYEQLAHLVPLCRFTYQKRTRTIYQIQRGTEFCYEPLFIIKRSPDGTVQYEDDFNTRTAERILTCKIIMDCPEAQHEALNALQEAGFVDRDAVLNRTVKVEADREGQVNIHHEYDHVFPNLDAVVYLDQLKNSQGANTNEISLNFIVVMPHLYGCQDAIELLSHTRLTISMGLRIKEMVLHCGLDVAALLASRLARELHSICYTRDVDGHQVAYVHQFDAAMLLEGFCDHFVPTPSPEVLVTSPYMVDQQILLALRACCPQMPLDYIPLEAAAACYRSTHLNPQTCDQMLLEVDLTELAQLDMQGYGARLKLHVPIHEEARFDTYISLEAEEAAPGAERTDSGDQ